MIMIAKIDWSHSLRPDLVGAFCADHGATDALMVWSSETR